MKSALCRRVAAAAALALGAVFAACAPADDPEKLFGELQSTDGEVRQEADEGQHALDRADPDRQAKPVLTEVSARLRAGGRRKPALSPTPTTTW